MSVRAKFSVSSIEKHAWGGLVVKLSAVWDDGIQENAGFAEALPSGSVSIHIDGPPALAFLENGKSYYLDFTAA